MLTPISKSTFLVFGKIEFQIVEYLLLLQYFFRIGEFYYVFIKIRAISATHFFFKQILTSSIYITYKTITQTQSYFVSLTVDSFESSYILLYIYLNFSKIKRILVDLLNVLMIFYCHEYLPPPEFLNRDIIH